MKFITQENIELFYKVTDARDETIVFSHGFLMNHSMFNGQVEVLKNSFRCVSFDHRGHGRSTVVTSHYTIDALVDDAIQMIESLECGPVHFVGMSTGGFVGMRIALKRPDLLKSLVLMDTSAEPESEQANKRNRLLIWMVRYVGWWAVIKQVMSIMFHESFLRDPKKQSTRRQWQGIITQQNKKALAAFGEAIFTRDNVLADLAAVQIPTAIIVGDGDKATRPENSQRMADKLPNSQLYTISKAGHSAAVEKPNEVADAMIEFYQSLGLAIN